MVGSNPLDWSSGWDASQLNVTLMMFTNNTYSFIDLLWLGGEEHFEGKVS